jgi:DNA polymerase-3 subunit delta'
VAEEVFRQAGVVDQDRAVAALVAAARAPVHAYLLVGPPGAGAAAAARGFSAALVCPDGGDGTCRACRLAMAGEHPDVATFAPSGAYLRVPEVEDVVREALRSPVEGGRKVLVLHEVHRVGDATPALLKTLEEPPASTVFVLLADAVAPQIATIASRCARVDLPALPPATIEAALVAQGVDAERAASVAPAALGDLERARVLIADEDLARRQRLWRTLPAHLDGTGSTVAAAVDELLEHIEEAASPLKARQVLEAATLEDRLAATGARGSGGRKALAEQHKRGLRRHRATELRFGLATLAAAYRDDLAAEPGDAAADVAAIDAITAAAEGLVHNPNETLLLQALFLRLPPLPAA